jgi:hypothetical protein
MYSSVLTVEVNIGSNFPAQQSTEIVAVVIHDKNPGSFDVAETGSTAVGRPEGVDCTVLTEKRLPWDCYWDSLVALHNNLSQPLFPSSPL